MITATIMLGFPLASSGEELTAWRIVAVDDRPPVDMPGLECTADGNFSGSTDCNGFSGRAWLEAGAFVGDEPIAVTMMACPSDALVKQERKIRSEKQADLSLVTVGEERYEIPDAVLFGG